METNQIVNIDEAVLDMPRYEISGKKSSPVKSIAAAAAGIAMLAVNYGVPGMAAHENLSATLMLLGGLLAFGGAVAVCAAVFGRSVKPVYGPTGERLRRRELFFDKANLGKVRDALEKRDFEALAAIPRSDGSAAVLVVYAPASRAIALMQLQEYVPHSYVPVSETVVLRKEACAAVPACLL